MELEIPYGQNDRCVVQIDAERVAGVVRSRPAVKTDEMAVLTKAFQQPVASQPLDKFLADADDLLVVVNADGRRGEALECMKHLFLAAQKRDPRTL